MQKGLSVHNLKFFNGMENYEESNAVGIDKLYNAENTRFTNLVISSKMGWQYLGNALAGGDRIQGMYQYAYQSGATIDKRLLEFYNKIFRQFDTGTQTWTNIATVWPNVKDTFTDGVEYNNVMYFVNPLTVGNFGGIGKIANNVFSVVPDAAAPAGDGIESWVERLWVINNKTNVVVTSNVALATIPAQIEDWTGGQTILVGKQGVNKAIRVLENQMYVWKEDSIYFNTVDRIAAGDFEFQQLSRTGGAINQKSTIIVENDVWFLTPQLEVRSLGRERNMQDNPRTRRLTNIIQRTMNLLDPVQDNPVAIYNRSVYKLHLKTRGSPTNNLTLVFDYNTGGWSIDIGQAVNVTTIWQDSTVYGEDSNSGQAYIDDTGFSANGLFMIHRAHTPFMDDNRPDTWKRARYIHFRGQLSWDQDVTIRLFRDGTYKTYSDYYIPSPHAQGMTQQAPNSSGQFGAFEFGDAVFGGDDSIAPGDILMYRIEKLISVDRRSNMFAIGIEGQVNGGKIITEQLELKYMLDNENYKRADI